ncbi:hypothetical protein [Massilia scottii]|uniref:hypothetical protein n=1 Tax=Massilia scottii TaxID=3057166 RepID=UPI00279694FE|nr:hypothetical protein [Massilia sp. CCM 9029]MDQ1830783.1 hypothetical protein [Massilia sp. CCM 9029]
MTPQPQAPRGNEPVRIVRGAGIRRIPAWHVHSLAALWRALEIAAPERQCLGADLTLGAWRGHWLAREWGQQIGLVEPDNIQPALYAPQREIDSYADTVATLIDNESEGDRNFMSAHALACALIAALREHAISHLLLAAPLAPHRWGNENIQLLNMLQDAAPHHGFRIVVLLRSDASVPHVPGLAFDVQNAPAPAPCGHAFFPVPGLAAPCAAAQYGAPDALTLRNGKLFISPNWRSTDAAAAPPAALEEHLQVYFMLRDGRQEVDFLRRQADLRFAEGAYELALHILESIDQDRIDPLSAALVESQAQNIAIALMDFSRAARGKLPAATLPAVVKASLYQSKAWGMVMSNQAAEAEQYFALARQLLDPRQYQRLYLYLLNISALNKLRLGHIEHALAIENDIESKLLALPFPDWHLIYINSLNQARIFKKCRDLERAELYYNRAFYINFQLRNESDLLYANLCYAQLEEMRGTSEKALTYWVRTCLHWLSNPLPEAIAPRVAQAILAQPLSGKEADVEKISHALLHSLQAAALALGRTLSPFVRPIALARIDAQSGAALCLAQPGWSVFGSRAGPAEEPIFSGPEYQLLNRYVVGLLADHFPHTDFTAFRALFTDAQCGIELADSPRELIWSCVKWQVPELMCGERRYAIDKACLKTIASLRVETSRAINYAAPGQPYWRVHFKRYLRPVVLNAAEQRCMEYLQTPSTLADMSSALGMDTGSCLHLINAMSEKRLVSVH